jgi:hypothetical protein
MEAGHATKKPKGSVPTVLLLLHAETSRADIMVGAKVGVLRASHKIFLSLRVKFE